MSLPSKWRCPQCAKPRTSQVVNSDFRAKDEPRKDVFRRVRKCMACKHRYTTYEIHKSTWMVFRKVLKVLKEREKEKTK